MQSRCRSERETPLTPATSAASNTKRTVARNIAPFNDARRRFPAEDAGGRKMNTNSALLREQVYDIEPRTASGPSTQRLPPARGTLHRRAVLEPQQGITCRPDVQTRARTGLRAAWQPGFRLALLGRLARALEAIFFPLFHPRIARQQARLFQHRPQLLVIVAERARDAVSDCTGLACHSTACHLDRHVKPAKAVDYLQRLHHYHLEAALAQVLECRLLVDQDPAFARCDMDARDGRLATARRLADALIRQSR